MHWFGEGPLKESSQKLHDLRESGYTGWVNQDGNAVDDNDNPVEDVAQWIRDHS